MADLRQCQPSPLHGRELRVCLIVGRHRLNSLLSNYCLNNIPEPFVQTCELLDERIVVLDESEQRTLQSRLAAEVSRANMFRQRLHLSAQLGPDSNRVKTVLCRQQPLLDLSLFYLKLFPHLFCLLPKLLRIKFA